jgi:hypothetical protein
MYMFLVLQWLKILLKIVLHCLRCTYVTQLNSPLTLTMNVVYTILLYFQPELQKSNHPFYLYFFLCENTSWFSVLGYLYIIQTYMQQSKMLTKKFPTKKNSVLSGRDHSSRFIFSVVYLQPATKIVIPFFSRKYIVINSANLCHISVLETWLYLPYGAPQILESPTFIFHFYKFSYYLVKFY